MPEGVPYLRREVYKLRKRIQDFETNLQILQSVVNRTLPREAFNSVEEARLAVIEVVRIDVLADGNGDPATFWVDETYVDDGFNVTGFTDASGTTFRRIQRV